MTSFRLIAIVEGHGEVRAVPVLIHRLVSFWRRSLNLVIYPALRVHRDRFIRVNEEFHRYVELAARRVRPNGAVLILLDAEEDCPAKLGPSLTKRARHLIGDVPFSVVLAKRKFESWFLAAAPSLAGTESLPGKLETPPDPEDLADPKRWLAEQLLKGKYIETHHQVEFTRRMDLELASQAPSFERFTRELTRLLPAEDETAQ